MGVPPQLRTCRVELRKARRVAEQHEPALECLLAALQGGRQLRDHLQRIGLCESVVLQHSQMSASHLALLECLR